MPRTISATSDPHSCYALQSLPRQPPKHNSRNCNHGRRSFVVPANDGGIRRTCAFRFLFCHFAPKITRFLSPYTQPLQPMARIRFTSTANLTLRRCGFHRGTNSRSPTSMTSRQTQAMSCAVTPCMDMTNLHFHGLTVSPDPPQDDVSNMMAMPGQALPLYGADSEGPPALACIGTTRTLMERATDKCFDGMSGPRDRGNGILFPASGRLAGAGPGSARTFHCERSRGGYFEASR